MSLDADRRLNVCDVRAQTWTDQTLLATRLAGAADVNPQGLLPQCTVGYLHAEHLADLNDVLRRQDTRPEETTDGLHTRQHGHAHVSAGEAGTVFLKSCTKHLGFRV